MATTYSVRYTFETDQGKEKRYTFSGTKSDMQAGDVRAVGNAMVTNTDALSVNLTKAVKAEIISTNINTITF